MLEKTVTTDVINAIAALQDDFLKSKTLAQRKALGQFFTGAVVSNYMASLVNAPADKSVRLLDAGAGVGILTASTAIHCLNQGCNQVHAVLFELDQSAIANLDKAMQIITQLFDEHSSTFTYEIHNQDFVLARPDQNKAIPAFDITVINPPYFKYSAKESAYAQAAADLYRGDPNIYASFMGVAMSCLSQSGQMVVISPRSFTNGLYFKGFRQYLLAAANLSLVHIFKSRDKVFQGENANVLQENIICRFIKTAQDSHIVVRSSVCDSSIANTEENIYTTSLIIDPTNDQKIIRIPETINDAKILKQAEKLASTFEGSGYFISTGPVVEHRTREFITEDTDERNTVPLYRPHNVTRLRTTWTGDHKKDVAFKLDENHHKHTLQNDTYVLLKRFSSKDEKRRLVSGVHLVNGSEHNLIGFGNKMNYIGVKDNKLTPVEAFGLSALFNSTFMDKYFRSISGNTQVNATEIRVLKFPSKEQVITIGEQVERLSTPCTAELDAIINPILAITDFV
jgi:adenine-specific DNA-methyltransferase